MQESTTTLSANEEKERHDLRRRHQVRPIEEGSEGTELNSLPPGVYGFTYAPAEDLVPLFRNRAGQSFEVHRLRDGTVRLVGYVTEADARQIAAWNTQGEIRLYPEPYSEAAQIAWLPRDDIVPSRRGPSRTDGNYLPLRLAPR